jgi:hypothetical protein
VSTLYDTDLVAWSEQQAALLRRRASNELDWDNVAEEIESVGKSEQRDLASRIQTVLDHLIRLRASPATEPRHGWERTLIVQRAAIERLLRDSPSLKPRLAAVIAEEFPTARRLALLALAEHGEAPGCDVEALHFSVVEVLPAEE